MSNNANTAHKGLVVVTGASSGIGAAIAKKFSAEGHAILLVARRVEAMQKLGLKADLTHIAKVDVTNKAEFGAAIEAAEAKFGPVSILVNNAGVMKLGDATEQDTNEWDLMIDVNVKGLLNGCHLVSQGMKKRKAGTIINVSSIAGKKTFPNHAVYCGTKFAVHAFSESLREELSQHNVKVTVIAPGVVETELLGHTTNEKILEGYKGWKKTMELGALLPEDVSDACWFASNQPGRCCIREIALAPVNQSA